MKRFSYLALIIAFLCGTPLAHGQTSVLRKPVQEMLEAIGRYVSKQSGKTVAEELAELGGEAAVRRITAKLVAEGGEEAVQRTFRLAQQYGVDVIRVADNVPNPSAVLRAVDDLPADQIPAALRRLASGSEGRLLAQLVEQSGSAAIRAELRHPGVGGKIVRHLGNDGTVLASRVDRLQAIQLARHAEDISRLPQQQREGILLLLHNDLARMIQWMGDFTMKNPGKVLFTAASVVVIDRHSKALLGGKSELVFDQEGNPVLVPRPGMIERMVTPVIKRAAFFLLTILTGGLIIWIVILLRAEYNKKLRVAR